MPAAVPGHSPGVVELGAGDAVDRNGENFGESFGEQGGVAGVVADGGLVAADEGESKERGYEDETGSTSSHVHLTSKPRKSP